MMSVRFSMVLPAGYKPALLCTACWQTADLNQIIIRSDQNKSNVFKRMRFCLFLLLLLLLVVFVCFYYYFICCCCLFLCFSWYAWIVCHTILYLNTYFEGTVTCSFLQPFLDSAHELNSEQDHRNIAVKK